MNTSAVRKERIKNPRENASWLSILTLTFALKNFRRSDFHEKDIYEIADDFGSEKLGNVLEKHWKNKRKGVSLWAILFRIFGTRYALLGLSLLTIRTALMLEYPLLIGKIVAHFTTKQTELTLTDAFKHTAELAFVYITFTFYINNYLLIISELSLKIKTSCCSLIYRKCLQLSLVSMGKCTSGSVVTLMTKDVLLFDNALDFGLMVIAGLFQACGMTYLMYDEIGVSALLGAGLLLVLLPIQVYLGKKTATYRLRTASRTDQRVRITQEILMAIRLIKMYTWELFFSKSVSTLRKKELTDLRILFYIKSLALSIGQLSSRVAFYICVMAYIALGNHITAEKAFVVTGCFAALRSVLTIYMPLAIAQIAELKASIQRITHFLQLEEVSENPNIAFMDEKQPKVSIRHATVTSTKDVEVLEDVNLEIKQGLTALTGSVGAGKSTLLKLILGDVKRSEGVVEVCGKVSYASQEPWLFPGTVRQNIVFGEWFDEKRYQTVIEVCALRKDFDAFPQGDRTCLTDRGLNLSRGQKTRINLARAVYKVADIYLLDDCLSAVDTHVGRHIFYQCLKGFLKDTLCILVTHQDQFLEEVDNIVILSKGCVKFQGTYGNLKEWDSDEIKSTLNNDHLDENLDLVEQPSKNTLANNIDAAEESTNLLVVNKTSTKNIYEETKEEGSVKRDVYYKYFTSGGGVKMLLLVLCISILAQATASWSDYFVSFWVDMEQDLSGFRFNQTTNSTEYKKLEESHDSVMRQYSFVLLAATVFTLLRAFTFFLFSTKASANIHNLILDKILNSGMTFFDLNLSGNVLNRFSRDLGIIDEQMPYTVFEVTRMILMLVATLLVVSSVNLFFLIPSTIFTMVLFFARRLYLPTGRSIRRLEGATRSPVIGHLNATLEGLTTIRASQAQEILRKEFDKHQDLYNSVAYMHLATTRAFGFYLDMLCSVYITVITLTFLFIKTDTHAGQVGLAITQSFGLTGLMQWGVRQWAELENQMTSAERVLEYGKVEPEDKSGNTVSNWPNKGKIVYTDVSLKYSATSEPVLKNINVIIETNQKVGIVGRTGAGKSSIVSTLFRMYNFTGMISIDDVDINSLEVEFLRSKISIIPQDPVLFSGTLRSNLDPNGEYADKDLWEALEEVEMKNLIGSLNSNILEGGANFSIGQRQLLCFARAILRKNRILILDEATANVDPQTDALIQRTIRRKFSDCTVITIAHRLHTIMDSDRVLVMDSGVAAEYDHPIVLLEKKGLFYKMVEEAGLL